MKHLEGETLAARIARGSIKVNEALKIAVEIAEALVFRRLKMSPGR